MEIIELSVPLVCPHTEQQRFLFQRLNYQYCSIPITGTKN